MNIRVQTKKFFAEFYIYSKYQKLTKKDDLIFLGKRETKKSKYFKNLKRIYRYNL